MKLLFYVNLSRYLGIRYVSYCLLIYQGIGTSVHLFEVKKTFTHITLDRIKITSVMFLTLHKASEFYFGPKDRKIHNQFMSSIYHAHPQPPLLPVYFLLICAFIHLFIIQQIQLLSAHYYGIWSSIDNCFLC